MENQAHIRTWKLWYAIFQDLC